MSPDIVETKYGRRFGSVEIVGKSDIMQPVYKYVGLYAKSDAAVLLCGETGTGKEITAKAIHEMSARSSGPFYAVAVPGLSESLLESELFGHEPGAFTGAVKQKEGKIELAEQGTLFLDEIGDISYPVQVKLLRYLETRKFERVGGLEEHSSDCRIMVATNRDLQKMIHGGEFRNDLYYRISTLPLTLPSLRQRAGDVDLLVEFYLNQIWSRHHSEPYTDGISEETKKKYREYVWAGNIREMINTVERAVVLSLDAETTIDDALNESISLALDIPSEVALLRMINRKGPKYLLTQEGKIHALRLVAELGQVQEAAKILGVTRQTLTKRLEEWTAEAGTR